MLKNKVSELLDKVFEENPELFLISLNVDAQNNIKVTIDGDKGVLLHDCITVSRALEQSLDSNVYNFSLEVSSAGATSPLLLQRQYPKNIGRELEVTTLEGKTFRGILSNVTPDFLILRWQERVPKEKGKGKITVDKEEKILFNNIHKSQVKIKF